MNLASLMPGGGGGGGGLSSATSGATSGSSYGNVAFGSNSLSPMTLILLAAIALVAFLLVRKK